MLTNHGTSQNSELQGSGEESNGLLDMMSVQKTLNVLPMIWLGRKLWFVIILSHT